MKATLNPHGRAKIALIHTFAMTVALTLNAAVITWQAPTTISDDSDINVSGVSVAAFGFGGGATSSVNGVTFTAVNAYGFSQFVAGSGEGALSMDAGASAWASFTASANAAPFDTLSFDYQTMIGTANYVISGLNATLTLQNLVVGQEYIVQFWVDDSRGFAGSLRTETFTSGNTSGAVEQFSSPNTAGSLGQFVTGSFIADGSTQSISAAADTSFILNAYQLRAVPEPATGLTIFLGCAVLFARRPARKLLGREKR